MIKEFNYKGLLVGAILIVIWQLASLVSQPYLFPPIQSIFANLVEIFTNWSIAVHALTTVGRILLGLVFAFLIGTLLGVMMGMNRSLNDTVRPLLSFVQGVPALSWVVIAVIWFQQVELRIFFIILVTALPNFTFQAYDSYNNISKDLREMLLVFRPKQSQLFKMLIIPSITPDLFTAWKVNLGNTTRVAIVAELVGSTIGVGYQLSSAQSLFDMSMAIAWTLVLVIFVIIFQMVLAKTESTLLSWRPKSER
ncbi:ABC transporter permease [Robertmurraya massiliosenegalensis]|uniref:ABC transporter permease n=1 Tax=Robertmurraya massiliosenegalensis TaxID=1287657 RepID=UPI0003093B3F|nr:ABC transporter permease [Robertmurraya massiliosenegalensis]